jgi:hypothetical protein
MKRRGFIGMLLGTPAVAAVGTVLAKTEVKEVPLDTEGKADWEDHEHWNGCSVVSGVSYATVFGGISFADVKRFGRD